MNSILVLCIGIGLSAACGYRVFVPLLGMSIASTSGHLSLPDSFAWIGSDDARMAFAVATVIEISAFYVPLIDNFLDTIAAPLAVIAGTLIMASFASGLSPFLKWSLALIAGGGTAGIFQGATTMVRGSSTVVTAGMGNFVLATAETGIAIALTLLAFIMPLITAIAILVIIFFGLKILFKKKLCNSNHLFPMQ